ncbi:hypothetical protein CC1G_02785 [Coprinopsis cinerea okayama7|uniref:Uncharacterized protein n=1 Tax=Coprinopsis cinerea (strain Okayama-7 / 130 / ATCC MYA-4618 / FGSC 9003) TaxID=240176 RepID=A8N015_COPC7|nr:hypothetical protein CC1G_02785 [Coprinopsis cinerea okayama7\|eukprot:XP_001828204.1 hypothetical protein CC1G_02785 [Coprinopsis cinerea okayama7\
MVALKPSLALIAGLLTMASTVVAWDPYYDYYDARSLDFYDDYELRGFDDDYELRGFDDDDFVLSARDLARLNVRASDISHVLVIRADPNAAAECKKFTDAYNATKKDYDSWNKKYKDARKKKDKEGEKKAKEKMDELREYVEYNREEMEIWCAKANNPGSPAAKRKSPSPPRSRSASPAPGSKPGSRSPSPGKK